MFIKKRIATLAVALTMILCAGLANADVVTFGDNHTHWPGWGGYQNQDSLDVIGIPDFTGGSATFNTSNPSLYALNSVSFDINPGNDWSSYNSLTSGDLFINTGKDSTWDYVVDLNGRTGGLANVFAVNLDYNDPNGYIMAVGGRVNQPAWADLSGLTPVAQASWTGLPNWGSLGTVDINGLDLDFTTLTLAYTVSCGNDVIFECSVAKTPIPGAVWLLGSGLMSLLGLRKRFIRA